MIRAHDSPVRIMAFNPEGTMLATTSDKGTVIRVFSLPTGKKLFTFRRGSYPAMVNSLSFNSTSSLLCLSSSDSSTIHVFALTPENSEEQREKQK
jgi:autophagy-related protein 18